MLRFVVFFVLAYLAWTYTASIGCAAMNFLGEPIVSLFDTHGITKSMHSSGGKVVLKYAPSPDGKPLLLDYRNLAYGTVLLTALVLAVPDIRWKLRLKILLLGMIILFPVQVLRLVLEVFNYYGQHITTKTGTLYPVVIRKGIYYSHRVLQRLDTQAIPLMIWAGLYFYYVWYGKYFMKRISTKPQSS